MGIFPYFNNWNPTLLQTVRSNHDIKIVTHGAEMKDISWYITNYATKKQTVSSNMSALLATHLAFHNAQEAAAPDLKKQNQKLIQRCSNTFSREQEFSAPEVTSYLMGWGDRYLSHTYASIYTEPLA
jgi:hypothetical protein